MLHHFGAVFIEIKTAFGSPVGFGGYMMMVSGSPNAFLEVVAFYQQPYGPRHQRLGSVGYNPNIFHLELGYNPFTNHLLTSWDILVPKRPKQFWFHRFLYYPLVLSGTWTLALDSVLFLI